MARIKFVTDEAELAFPHLAVPQHFGDRDKYGVVIVFDKESKVCSDLRDVVRKTYDSIEWKGEQKPIGSLKLPVVAGDFYRKDDPMFAGKMCMEAQSFNKPIVVDLNGTRLENSADIYSGCKGRLSVFFEPYMKNGEYVGIGCRLVAVQRTSEGRNDFDSVMNDFGISQSVETLPF